MDKKYFDSTHRFGRIGALIGIVFMLGIPAVISQVYGVCRGYLMKLSQ